MHTGSSGAFEVRVPGVRVEGGEGLVAGFAAFLDVVLPLNRDVGLRARGYTQPIHIYIYIYIYIYVCIYVLFLYRSPRRNSES